MDEGGSIKRIFLPEERIHHPVVGCHMSENLFDSVFHVALNLLFPAPWQLNLKGWENLAKYLLDQNTVMALTLKVSFCPKECNGQPEYGETIQLRQYVLLEWQERSQMVELAIKPLPMPF